MRFAAPGLIVIALLAGGCAQLPVQPTGGYQLQQMRHWYDQARWHIEGRLGVVSDLDSFSASFTWQHAQDRDIIDIAGPLGQGRVLLKVTPEQVLVDDGKHVRIYRETMDALLLRYLGVDVPVQALPFWLLGLVEPQVSYQETDRGFIQHGWRVIYRQLQPVQGGWLPHKINLEKNSNKLKLIVDQWVLS